ncbi:DUF2851 family protein [Flavimarina sp. Hel_I_48]|uniref:DUF2851 family protein n=1 Tax=Flavimarina sp. Hel_I_48 TaxID=1392488 RepID=UPI0004DF5AB3|nr:DUF2851 family protein [Flavimarina sp. Hel_I_48]
MKEDFLQYLWKYKKFEAARLKTTEGKDVAIVSVGMHNQLAGPDFFNARIRIDGQLWAGNIELHVKASQWYGHGHEKDRKYDNVILHVVWEDDIAVYGVGNAVLPTLLLKSYVTEDLLSSYKKLFDRTGKRFINCEQDFHAVPDPLMQNWLERLYFERLERKVKEVDGLLKTSKNDWEAALFFLLMRSFGTKINGAAFAALAGSIPFKIIRKSTSVENALEPLLLGQAGLLMEQSNDIQVLEWKKEYAYLKHKYELPQNHGEPVQFFKLRPPNFPTIRLSQVAALYSEKKALFSKLMQAEHLDEYYELLSVKASPYWDMHYTFGKTHKARPKSLSRSFINILLINTIIPLKFAYLRSKTTAEPEKILELIAAIPTEKNSIVDSFFKLRKLPENALTSQALLELKNNYCDPNACLKCQVGNYLISNPDTL